MESTSIVSDFAGPKRYYLLFSGIRWSRCSGIPSWTRAPAAGPLVVDYLAEKGVGILVAGRFGPPMVEAMNRRGMKYFLYSGIVQEAAERDEYLKPGKKGGREKPGDLDYG